MEKLKIGDRVRVLDTENVRHYNPRGIGFEFIINKYIFRKQKTKFISPDNTFGTNYLREDVKIISNKTSIYELWL